jgi:predicted outer membrane repeat protein
VTRNKLQAAINNADPGDLLTLRGTCVGSFTIGKDLTIEGVAGTFPTVDGNDAGRVLQINNGSDVELVGLTITGGMVTGGAGEFGAGIRNLGTLTVRKSKVLDNHATGGSEGGGIENGFGASLSVVRTKIRNNSAEKGGAIHAAGPVTLTKSTLSDNEAVQSGGGIDMILTTVTLNDTAITGNAAGTQGGGVFNLCGTLALNGTSSVSGNTPDDVHEIQGCS